MGGCASAPAEKYETTKEVADLKAQAGAGVICTLFFPDAKLPCRNARQPGGCRRQHCDYAHDATNLTRFLDYLASAKSTLDICVFTITNDDIADVVLDCHRRGVKVRIITDNDQATTTGSDINKFRQAGIPVRQDNTPAHMHHKFAIIDGRLLMNGSFNWTRQAVTSNNENVTVLADVTLIKSFQAQFDKLWAQFK
ncbi:Mitochondrial cardiolipin hydrolase [Tetrabaena socialis]|uniref:Mitochondrial cardiolipin hydrolase n=1 Tax=Tetrabaena socialis TaxID=47790 RepID=A0A2J8AF98_9CHLO|nr:Mitochondrial cardiolipin hydrolase [Tetrabaena socialis]|eukprot:PNH11184.1 Mitochondrial cardiolipin hydrolase [Tetrabaena socialis]